ncbi:MAG: hypothetical protein AB8B51_14210 [Sedimentitalea sp.]
MSWVFFYFAISAMGWIVRNTGWLGRVGWDGWPRRWFGFLILASEKDVRAALRDPEERFRVAAGPDQKALFRDMPNTLGLDGVDHLVQRDVYHQVLAPPDRDLSKDMAEVAFKTANALLDDARGDIDVINDLLRPVLAECAFQVHGMPREDPEALLTWTFRAAEQFVSPFAADELALRRAFESARRIYGSQLRGILAPRSAVPPGSTLDRLRQMRDADLPLLKDTDNEMGARAYLTDDRAANIMIGLAFTLATQFLPDSHALNHVLRHRKLRQRAERLARQGDSAGMRALIQENFRRHPATWPWVVRHVALEGDASADFSPDIRLRHGETALICIPSALREQSRRTNDTLEGTDLAFGVGAHACMGRDMAEAVATQIFMALFARQNVKPAGPMLRRLNELMPARLPVTYQAIAPKGGQVVATAVVPLRANEHQISKRASNLYDRALRRLETRLGRPLSAAFLKQLKNVVQRRAERRVYESVAQETAAALARVDEDPADLFMENMRSVGGLHGLGITLVSLTMHKDIRPHMVIEVNADGPWDSALDRFQQVGADILRPTLEAAGWRGTSLKSLFENHSKSTKPRLWGDAGLAVNGVTDWSVAQIEQEKRLADMAERCVDDHLKTQRGPNAALETWAATRAQLKQNPDVSALLTRPPSTTPAFAAHSDVSFSHAMWRWVGTSGSVRAALLGFVAVVCAWAGWATWSVGAGSWGAAALIWVAMALSTVVVLGGAIGAIGWLFWRAVQRAERRDPEDEHQPNLTQLAKTTAREDHEGVRLNHLALVVELKPGQMRRVVLTFAMWIIAWMNTHWFRPGWNANIGSIRHARFVRLKGAKQAVFLSSFDGSWSSYIGDFSDLATEGMSLFWSNFTGFPRTKDLVNDGAYDDEKFKRWVRGRQVPAALWRQRFPDLNNATIRRNALVREGLARELTRSEAERWLNLFGSRPAAAPDSLVPEDTQSIVFSSFGRFPASACVAVQIADGKTDDFRAALARLSHRQIDDTGSKTPVISFGAAPNWRDGAVATFGLSSRGMERLGTPSQSRGPLGRQLHHFPTSFVEGMGRRARTLGDPLPNGDPRVRWIDRSDGHTVQAREIDAVFLVAAPARNTPDAINAARQDAVDGLLHVLGDAIAPDPEIIKTELPQHKPDDQKKAQDDRDTLRQIAQDLAETAFGQAEVQQLRDLSKSAGLETNPTHQDEATGRLQTTIERYAQNLTERPRGATSARRKRGIGFADGVSQPVIAGAPGVRENSKFAIAAGEFILGKTDQKGLLALSPLVPAAWDLHCDLPDPAPFAKGKWPNFAAPKSPARDLGRDGTFMVIRQLEVDGDQFQKDLGSATPPDTSADDLGAKIIGRRRDGSPVGSPSFSALQSAENPMTQTQTPAPAERPALNFAKSDPWGHDVPLGAHVRRSHPRDSFDDPSDPKDMTHRHRILRRGRRYFTDDGKQGGLLFVCLNASIERQFEFIQQTWINAPSFHGLVNEIDPLMGHGHRTFSVPSPQGREKIELKNDYVGFCGGGYFFVPGRAALRALTRKRH